jgi:hypothetical protein
LRLFFSVSRRVVGRDPREQGMIEIVFAGNEADRAAVKSAAQNTNLLVSSKKELGFDGAEVVKLILNDGPQAVELLSAIVVLIKNAIDLKRACKVTVDTKPTKPAE